MMGMVFRQMDESYARMEEPTSQPPRHTIFAATVTGEETKSAVELF
jgi:hypothetical protein